MNEMEEIKRSHSSCSESDHDSHQCDEDNDDDGRVIGGVNIKAKYFSIVDNLQLCPCVHQPFKLSCIVIGHFLYLCVCIWKFSSILLSHNRDVFST